MKKRKHLQTNYFKFIIEKYNQELQNEIDDEETNLSNDEIIDDIDNIEEPKKTKDVIDDDDNDEDLNIDKLIEEYNKLTNKYKKLKG
jgi:hypothetical protein